VTRSERERVIERLKRTEFEIAGTEPIERSTVVGGGLSLDEADLATGRVGRFDGLYAAGELLDTWAETGGYNLHFAWATGITVAEDVAGKTLD
jgi:predicted flavoprotein YhiN